MPSYEVVLDNSKLLANCSEENPESGAVMATRISVDPVYIMSNPIAAYFKTPTDFVPELIAFKMRVESIAGTPQHNYDFWARLSTADNSHEYYEMQIGVTSGTPVTYDRLMYTNGVPDIEWINGFWQAQEVNLEVPHGDNGWGDVNYFDAGFADELMGAGLRIDLGLVQEEDLDHTTHELFRIYEFHLLVYGAYPEEDPQIVEVSPYLEGPGWISAAFVILEPSWFGSFPRLA